MTVVVSHFLISYSTSCVGGVFQAVCFVSGVVEKGLGSLLKLIEAFELMVGCFIPKSQALNTATIMDM